MRSHALTSYTTPRDLTPDSSGPQPRSEGVSPLRLLGYGLSALAATVAGTWGLAELATPPGIGLATVDLSSLGRTVGLIAAATVGVPAAVLAYHRQRALDTANRTAANQHEHTVQADHREHRTGVERHLRERYTTCAEQLGHDNAAIRLAGAYALASLADDWNEFGNDSERQVCIDLLCAYLRTHRQPPTGAPAESEFESPSGSEDRAVRSAIISAIRTRTMKSDSQWIQCRYDLSDANLTAANLAEAILTAISLDGANLTRAFLLGTDLTSAILPGADLTSAILRGAKLADALMVGANMTGTDLTRADLTGADLAHANLTGANMTGADLTRADLTGADLAHANLTGANMTGADLTGVNLNSCNYSAGTRWPAGFVPPQSASEAVTS